VTITIENVRAARSRIAGAVVETPCAWSRTLSEITGARVILKFETQQFTASFKERGALNKLLGLNEADRAAGVIAMSAGNHAQGVAYHARRLGIPATIVMPRATPFIKIEQTRHLGPRVMLEGDDLDGAEVFARALAESEDLTFVHPYDDDSVIAGQGTLALEMLAAHPDIEVLVVPVGGGGLIAGCAVAAKATRPEIEVIGVESETYPSMADTLAGRETGAGGPTIAEGIAVARPGGRTLPLVRDLVAGIRVVPEAEIERAVLMLLEVEKTVVEGAGAAGLAALLAAPDRFATRCVGLILSGGNIDSRVLSSIILRGLAREGRLTRLTIEIADAPGNLARAATVIGEHGGNIVDVAHERAFSRLPVTSAILTVAVETRNADHGRELLARLAEAGFSAAMRDQPESSGANSE
jgi:threonine dehydratase